MFRFLFFIFEIDISSYEQKGNYRQFIKSITTYMAANVSAVTKHKTIKECLTKPYLVNQLLKDPTVPYSEITRI